jgi:energy-converting hydrogenase Eha subunit C
MDLVTRLADTTVTIVAAARSALLPPGWHRTGFLSMVEDIREESLVEALRLVLVELGRGLADERESRITFAIGAIVAGIGESLLNYTSSDGDASVISHWVFLALFIGVAAEALYNLHHEDPRFLSYFFAPVLAVGSVGHALTAQPQEPVDHLLHNGLLVLAAGAVLLMVAHVAPRLHTIATLLTVAGMMTVIVNNMVWSILHATAGRTLSSIGAFMLGLGTWIFVRALSAAAGFPARDAAPRTSSG